MGGCSDVDAADTGCGVDAGVDTAEFAARSFGGIGWVGAVCDQLDSTRNNKLTIEQNGL
jgi:hypothetical protein